MKFKKVAVIAATTLATLSFSLSAKADTQSELDAVKSQIEETQKKIDEGQVSLSKLQDEQTRASQKIESLTKNINARTIQLNNQARAAQLNNATSMIKFISDSKDLTDAVSRTFTVATVVKANNNTIEDQKRDKREVDLNKRKLEEAAEKQKATNQSLQMQRVTLAVQQTDLEVKKAKEDEQARQKAEEAKKAAEQAALVVSKAKDEQTAVNAANEAEKAASSVTNNQGQNQPQNNQLPNPNQTVVPSVDTGSVVGAALSLAGQGIPYVWGGSSLSGMDCSGLTMYVYSMFGKSLPHNTVAQEARVTRKSVDQAQPGDLLFWGAPGSSYHVAVYIGGGRYVHAPTEGQNVKVGSVSTFSPSFAGTVN